MLQAKCRTCQWQSAPLWAKYCNNNEPVNNNNEYLECLTHTGPMCLHILYKYILSKFSAYNMNTHTHRDLPPPPHTLACIINGIPNGSCFLTTVTYKYKTFTAVLFKPLHYSSCLQYGVSGHVCTNCNVCVCT